MNLTKFFIDQHGCAKNQTDGELIVGFLSKNGFEFTQNADEAQFIIINSCGFIESAKKESINAIYDIKSAYPNAKIILAGCLAERYATELYENIPELDGVFGNGNLSKIVDFMKSCQNERTVQTFPQQNVCSGERPVLFNFPCSAFVKITEGCSNHCSFCAIPLIRGELRSRNESEIINEIKSLIEKGIYEINLIGQDLAAYGTEINASNVTSSQSPLAALFAEISKLQGDFIIRPLYIHPDHFNLDILEVMKNDSRFVPYFDIPFQSGDDTLIQKMNRTGTQQKYIELVNNIRKIIPQTVLRTTFLTGFPGETDKAAENTLHFLNEIKPDWSGCFPYSREDDTPAYKMKGKIPTKIAQKRAEILSERQTELTMQKLQSYIGQTHKILIEEVISTTPTESNNENDINEENNSEGLAIGRAWFQAPDVDGAVVVRYEKDFPNEANAIKPGNVIEAKIIASTGVDLDSRFIKLYKEFTCDKIKFL